MKVYVVDDQRSVRKLLLASLQKEFEASAYESAKEVLEACKLAVPDIILSDLMMPEMNGMDLIRAVKSDPELCEIPIILLTSDDDVSNVKEALELGAHDYLLKPCLPVELTARLKAAFRFASARKELKQANEELSKAYRLIKSETEEIGNLQRILIPSGEEFQSSWFKALMFYRPCMDSGGDFFDIVDLGNGRFAFAIADVSGHGARSTVIMAVLKSLFTEYVYDVKNPAELLTVLNQKLLQCLPVRAFITFFIAFVDFNANKMLFSNSGHETPILYRDHEKSIEVLNTTSGYPLLLDLEPVYSLHEAEFFEHDKLFLYTDGLYDVKNRNGDRLGFDSLSAVIKNTLHQDTNQIKETIQEILTDYFEQGSQPDDITWILIESRRT